MTEGSKITAQMEVCDLYFFTSLTDMGTFYGIRGTNPMDENVCEKDLCFKASLNQEQFCKHLPMKYPNFLLSPEPLFYSVGLKDILSYSYNLLPSTVQGTGTCFYG